MNSNRRRIFYLIMVMVYITCLINVFAFGILYLRVFEQHRSRLAEIARGHILLIEAMICGKKASAQKLSLETAIQKLQELQTAHEQFNSFGRSVEFFVVYQKQNQIHFFISHRHDGQPSKPLLFDEQAALPMKLALSNSPGTQVAINEHGEEYLVAYDSFSQFDMGVVVRIHTEEIQQPFLYAGIVSSIVALLLLLSGVFLIHRISNPILNSIQGKENQLQALLDTVAEGVITINEVGTIESFNLAAEKMFGYSPQEVLRKNVSILMPDPYQSEHDSYLQRFLETGEKRIIGSVREVSAKRKNQDVFPIELSVSEVQIATKGKQFCGIIRDITKRKQAEQELQNTQSQLIQSAKLASLGEIATGIAHELNQPLASISMNAEMMLEEVQEKKVTSLEGFCQIILEQVERASIIVNHLKTFGRKSSLADQKEYDLNQIIHNAFSLLQEQFRLRDIQLQRELYSEHLLCLCNKVQIEQVLINLLVNARDAVENQPEKKIWIRSFPQEKWNIIEVQDNGMGISKKNKSSLFEPFFTTKDVGKGTGLGLSISHGIIKNHQGEIEVESEEGQGALFRLKLPITQKIS